MTPDRVACAAHRAPFRAKWPMGWALFTTLAFRRLGATGAFGGGPAGDPLANARHIESVLDAEPACCRLGHGEVMKLYDEAQEAHGGALWPTKLCAKCHRLAACAVVPTAPHARAKRVERPLCLWCVVTSGREDGPPPAELERDAPLRPRRPRGGGPRGAPRGRR